MTMLQTLIIGLAALGVLQIVFGIVLLAAVFKGASDRRRHMFDIARPKGWKGAK